MPELDPILAEMTELAERMTVLSRSWRQGDGSDSGPPPAAAVSGEPARVEIDSIAARLRAIRLSDHTGPPDRMRTFQYDAAAREAVDLATGILMEQHGIDAEAALALLEQLTGQLPMETLAEEVVRDQVEEGHDQARADTAAEHSVARAKDPTAAESLEG